MTDTITAAEVTVDYDEPQPFRYAADYEERVFAATIGCPAFLDELADIIRPEFFSDSIQKSVIGVAVSLYNTYHMRASPAVLAQEVRALAVKERWEQAMLVRALTTIVQGFRLAEHIESVGETNYIKDKVTAFALSLIHI